jgi:hypothetical protein
MKTTRRCDSPLYKRHYQFYNGCGNPNCAAWAMYGAKGIRLYQPWNSLKAGFDNFEDWVWNNLGPIPFPDAIIRRMDSTKNIKPGNLEWSTRKIMSNHRTTNVFYKINGQIHTLSEWSDITGINSRTAWSRIRDHGMTPKKALGL